VRYSGLDVTVRQSDQRRAPGHLSRQGPPALRWALYEAAQAARRPSSPDRAYYDQLAARIGAGRACIAISRKLLKRSYHLLRAPRRPRPRARLRLTGARPVTRQAPTIRMNRGQFPKPCCRPLTGDGPERPSRRNPSAGTPYHTSRIQPSSQPGSRAEVSLGVRGHITPARQRAHAPPREPSAHQSTSIAGLTLAAGISKQDRAALLDPVERRGLHRSSWAARAYRCLARSVRSVDSKVIVRS
jgi:hypothetical protein